MVKTNWTEDYYRSNPSELSSHTSFSDRSSYGGVISPTSGYRRRTPFVPFALTNETGCVLWFRKQTTSTNTRAAGPSRTRTNSGVETPWVKVEPDETFPFSFEVRGKLRHMNTHDVKIHQIVVRGDSWHEVSPVSVDRVGTFFRRAEPIPSMMDFNADLPPAR